MTEPETRDSTRVGGGGGGHNTHTHTHTIVHGIFSQRSVGSAKKLRNDAESGRPAKQPHGRRWRKWADASTAVRVAAVMTMVMGDCGGSGDGDGQVGDDVGGCDAGGGGGGSDDGDLRQ